MRHPLITPLLLLSWSVAGGHSQLALAVTVLSAVSLRPASTQVPADTRITLERTACFGMCPVYSVTIDASGLVTYNGTAHVRVSGEQTHRIDTSAVAAILETAQRIHFFALNDSYRADVTDLPTTYVTIVAAGHRKRIEDYVGAPEGLRELERQIDEAAGTVRWIRIDEPTLADLTRAGWAPTARELNDMLLQAVTHDEVGVAEALLSLGANPNGEGTTLPLRNVRSGEMVRALLSAGANAFARDQIGISPLFGVATQPAEVMKAFLEFGVGPDTPIDASGRTVLFLAACDGHVELVHILLRAGSNPAIRHDGRSALDCARERNAQSAFDRAATVFPPLFRRDLDAVIAALEEAVSKRKP